MAKNVKKGLGRGLNSLLAGESYEDNMRNVSDDKSFIDNIETIDGDIKIRKVNHNEENNVVTDENKELPDEKSQESHKDSPNQNILEIELDKLIANPNQPRTNFDLQVLDELAESIKRNGLLQPILVCKKDDKYEVIAGERRLRASKIAGLSKVPVIIKDTTDDKKLEIALIENIQREDLNPMEEAYSYQRILETQGVSHAELATIVSKGRSTITNSLRLLELPEKAQKLLHDNKITSGHARAILSVPTSSGRDKLIEKIVNEKISVREAESLANLYKGQSAKALKTVKPSAPKSFKKAAKLLREYFNNMVKVKKSKGKNKIEIEFNDESDLERILGLIVK